MASYYRQINNVKFDRALLDKAADLQAGKGDGRISKDDAVELSAEVYDGGQRTPTEDKTVRKIRREANFTPAGADAFEHANRSNAAKQAWAKRFAS